MSLTIISQPQMFELAGTPKELRLQTNNLLQNNGSKARYRFTVSIIPNGPNQAIDFFWDDNAVTLLTKLSPDDSGNQYNYDYPSADAYAWAIDNFVTALQSNYLLNRDFEVSQPAISPPGTLIVDLIAREYGPQYNLTVNIYTQPVGGITGSLAVAGISRVIHPNFESYVELYISRSTVNNWQRISLSQRHSTDNSIFPLHPILTKDYYGSALPDYGSLALKNISNAIIKYYMKYGEAYGEPKQIRKLTATPIKYALNGGYSKDGHARIDFTSAHLLANRTILTAIDAQRISTGQWQYLNYLHNRSVTQFRVYADITYTDGTVDEVTLFNQNGGVSNPSLWCIPAGYNAIAPLVNASKTVSNYTVWVGAWVNRSTQYSQVINFMIDTRIPIEESQFLYKTSYGVYEVIRFTGTVTELTTIQKTQAMRHLAADYAVTDSAAIITTNTHRSVLEINSGYKSKQEMRLLVDFLNSPSVYFKDKGYFRPVVLQVDEVQLAASRSGRINAITFKAIADTENTYYNV